MRRSSKAFRFLAVFALAVAAAAFAILLDFGSGGGPSSAQAEAIEESTVRISAQRLANGRTEFGLQVQQGGEWVEERLSPSRPYLTKSAQTGRWYQSGELQLDSGHVVQIAA